MKYDCDMIVDLLPLYKDGICSSASAKVIEDHLAECPKCCDMLGKLNDTAIDDIIASEKENVIESQSKFFRRKSAVAGMIVAAIFAIPILICLIADLAGGNGLGWFFIVLAAMLIPASLFVVPLLAPKNRMFLSMCSLTISIILLLAVCCIYSGGNWFFIAASSVLFGLTICFAPFIACRRPIKQYLKNYKGLAVMAAYTLTFYLMIICIGICAGGHGYFNLAFGITVPIFLVAWIMFLIIRYLPANGLVKAGSCIAAFFVAGYVGSRVILYIEMKIAEASDVFIYQEPSISPMIIGMVIGVIFIAIGLLVGRKGGNK